MNSMCNCDCNDPLYLRDPLTVARMMPIRFDNDGYDNFPIRCQCTKCGPVTVAGRQQCAAQLTVVAAYFLYFGFSGDPVYPGLRRSIFCEECTYNNFYAMRNQAEALRRAAQYHRERRWRESRRVQEENASAFLKRGRASSRSIGKSGLGKHGASWRQALQLLLTQLTPMLIWQRCGKNCWQR